MCVPRVMGRRHCSSHLADVVFQLPATPLKPCTIFIEANLTDAAAAA